MTGIINAQYSFFIAPDGSKEGWEESNNCDDARTEFTQWLIKSNIDYIEVRFGGDDKKAKIISSNGKNS